MKVIFFMKKLLMKKFFYKIIIFCVLIIQDNGSVYANDKSSTSFYRNFDQIKLKDQNNQTFTTDQLASKIAVFNFIYTNCVSVCSTQTIELAKIINTLSPEVRKDIRFISVSLDPVKDDSKTLKKFALNFNANVEEWFFLSTNFQGLNLLASKISLFKEDHGKTVYESINQVKKKQVYKLEDHTTGLWLIDNQGQIRQRYVGNPIETSRIVSELTTLHKMQFNK